MNSTLGVSVDEAISFIVEALKDPLNPRWCAPCIMGGMVVVQPDTGDIDGDDHAALEALINRNHLFGSTIVAFLTVERSMTAIKDLASRWSKCSCTDTDFSYNPAVMPLHQLAATMSRMLSTSNNPRYGGKIDVLAGLVRNFARFFDEAVKRVKPLSISKGRHPENWPANPKAIIPYGPKTTIESLVMWSRYTGSANIFSLIHHFIRICGPLIIPATVASRSTPNYMVEHGLQICSDVSSAPLNSNGKVDDYTSEVFIHELRYTASFIHSILCLPPLLYRDFHFGVAKDVFDFATRVILTLESPIFPECHKQWLDPWPERLAQYAARLYTIQAEQMTIPLADVHPAIRAVLNEMATPSPPANFACEMMRHARSLQFCFAAGCSESAQSAGRSYMRCSGCRVVAYSSKECQKRAWTDKHLPHRDICKKMKQVYDIGGQYVHREADQAKFVREMRRANIKDTVLQEIGMWLSMAYTKLQRQGPLLTPGVKQYLSEKKGPCYPKGAEEFFIQVESSMSKPKRRKARA